MRARIAALACCLPLLLGPACRQDAGWQPVALDALTAGQEQQRARAETARDRLAAALLQELGQALAAGGAAAAIAVCREAAPRLAAEVATASAVRIGRTSFRLRNAANAPPPWAAPMVAAQQQGPRFLAGPGGAFGALYPILLQPQCVQCHGSEEQIAPAVREQLRALYPGDRATGFLPGALRGWFWVEVPGGS